MIKQGTFAIIIFALIKSSFAEEYIPTKLADNGLVTQTIVAGQAATIERKASGQTIRTLVTKKGHKVTVTTDSYGRIFSAIYKGVSIQYWYDTATGKSPVSITFASPSTGQTKTFNLDDDDDEELTVNYWTEIIELDFFYDMDLWAAKDCSLSACEFACDSAAQGTGLGCLVLGGVAGLPASPGRGLAVGAVCATAGWGVWSKCRDKCKIECK